MILEMSLKNFKQHSSLHIDFTKGVNAITGENFAGKSSILHALLYGFWGALAVPGGAKIVQKRGTSSHEVAFSWQQGEDVYRLRRTVSVCNLWKNGKEDEHLVATGASSVGAKLIEMFGMDRADFCDIKYSEQKKAEQMLTLGATRVHALIEKITDVEKVNTVVEKLKAEGQRISIQLETMSVQDLEELLNTRVEFSRMADENRQQLEQATAQLTELNGQIVVAADELSELKTKSAVAVQAIRRHHQIVSELAEKKVSLDSAVAQMNNRPQLPSAEEIKTKISALQVAAVELETRQTVWGNYDQNCLSAKTTLQHYKDQVVTLTAELNAIPVVKGSADNLQGQLQQTESTIARVQQGLADLRAELKSNQTTLKALKDSKETSICHTCHRAFEGTDLQKVESDIKTTQTLVASRLHDIEQADAELDVQQFEREKILLKLADIEKHATAVARVQQAESSRDAAQSVLEAITKPTEDRPDPAALGKLRLEISDAQAVERDIAIAEINRANLAEKITKLTQETTTLNTELIDLHAQHSLTHETVTSSKVPFAAEIETLQVKVSNLNDQHREINAQFNVCTGSAESLKQKLVNIEEKIIRANEVNEEKKRLTLRLDRCKRLGKFLRDNKDTFLTEVWQKITGYASTIARTCTGGKITEVVRTTDGKFEYWEDGEVFPVEAASGAQRSIMGLGVQLALSEMLPSPFATLMLDEPTADMSDTVSMSLSTLLSRAGNQVLMVSHRELDGTVAENSIHL